MSAWTPPHATPEKPDEPARPDAHQKPLDFLRGEQLNLLRDVELPRDAKDKAGKGVRATALKAMLYAIDQFARGRAGGCVASVATLAAAANIGRRTATRAVEVLQLLGLVCVTGDGVRGYHAGQPTNRYTIVWSELRVRVDRGPLFHANGAPRAAAADPVSATRGAHWPQEVSATRTEVSATRTEVSATRTEVSATRTEVSATGGAPSDVFEDDRIKTSDVARDDRDDDGEKKFQEAEAAEIREKANRLASYIDCRRADNRNLVAKIALLWQAGDLAEYWIEDTLEALQAHHEPPIANRVAYTWGCLRDKCEEAGLKFEALLAKTGIPLWMLLPPEVPRD